MHRILLILTLLSLTYAHAEEVAKKTDAPIAVGMQLEHLGHGLWIHGAFSSQDSGWREHRCYIGYRVNGEDGGFEIIPILRLPPLTNDSYAITIDGKQMVVTRRTASQEVVRIEVAHLRIPEKQAEQGSAHQPTTRPESKSE